MANKTYQLTFSEDRDDCKWINAPDIQAVVLFLTRNLTEINPRTKDDGVDVTIDKLGNEVTEEVPPSTILACADAIAGIAYDDLTTAEKCVYQALVKADVVDLDEHRQVRVN